MNFIDRRNIFRTIVVFAIAAAITACGDPEDPESANQQNDNDVPANQSPNQPNNDEPDCQVQLPEDGEPFDRLSDYCFFGGDPPAHEPVDGVVLFEPTAPLYSDRSRKKRFIVLPEGETIGFSATESWEWPEGAILVKTFYFPHDARTPEEGRDILETRLLMKRDGQWEPEIYIWNDDQTDAELNNVGRRVDIEFVEEDGETHQIDYRIPNANQCVTCHGEDGDNIPLGPRTYQLNSPLGGDDSRPVQLAELDELEMFDQPIPDSDDLPAITDPRDESAPLDDRARAYLDANCASCHATGGRASSSNLHLEYDEEDERKIGICKTPVAAGQGSGGKNYDIVPGEPDESILVYRMESNDPEIKMPELPITTVDEFGVDLVREWIAEMEPPGCE